MNRYEPSEDKKIYEKCIGIARKIDNFVFTVENGNFFLSYGDPEKKMQMDRVLFFKLDTNEIINLLLKRQERMTKENEGISAGDQPNEELTRGQAFKNVYTHLKGLDIKDIIETKDMGRFKPRYLSWTHVWEMLLQNYPDFDVLYTPLPPCEDGSQAVACTITIPLGDHTLRRSEQLYVMDNRHNAVVNPNSKDINTTQKRCFVKCAALFGLGIQLYTGEDIPDVESKAQPKPVPVAAPKPAPAPVVEKVELAYEGEKGAENWVSSLVELGTVSAKSGTPNALRSIWAANKSGIDYLHKDSPEQWERLKEEFTILTSLIDEDENNG